MSGCPLAFFFYPKAISVFRISLVVEWLNIRIPTQIVIVEGFVSEYCLIEVTMHLSYVEKQVCVSYCWEYKSISTNCYTHSLWMNIVMDICRAEECMVVENAPLGVRAAKAAGLFACAVNTGPLPDSDLTDEGADRVFPDMAALLDWLKNSPDISI